MTGLPRPGEPLQGKWALIAFGFTATSVLIIAGAVYWVLAAAEALALDRAVLLGILAAFALEFVAFKAIRARLPADRARHLISVGALVLGNVILGALALYYGIAVLRDVFGGSASWVIAALAAAAYVALIWYAARVPELEMDDPNSPIIHL